MIYLKKNYLFVSFVLIVLALLFISSFSPIITRGEGREGLIVKSLSWGESFILPLRHGTEIPSKPPLFHWIGYGISQITGEVGPLEVRAGSAVGTAILLVGTYLFFTAHAGSLLGLLTTLILFSSLEVLRYSTQARVDPLFAGVFSAAVYCMFSFYVGKGSQLLTAFGSLLFLVLAVLAKGPFGLILPAAVLVLYLFAKWEVPDSRVLLKGLVIFIFALLLSSIWYFLAYKVGGDRFLDVQLLKENAYRVVKADGDDRGHEKPFFFSLIFLFLAFIPWSLFLPRIISGLIALKKESEFKNNQILVFTSLWLLLFVLAVMESVSKRSVYFLPAMPALSFLTAICFVRSQSLVLNKFILKYERFLGLLVKSALLLLMLAVLGVFFEPVVVPFLSSVLEQDKLILLEKLAGHLSAAYLLTYLALVIFVYMEMSIGFSSLNIGRAENGIIKIALSLVILFYGTQVLVVSRILGLESPVAFIEKVVEILPKYEPLKSSRVFQYKSEYYAPAFYLDRPVPNTQRIDELTGCGTGMCAKMDTYVFAADIYLEDFKGVPHQVVLESKNKLANREYRLLVIKIPPLK